MSSERKYIAAVTAEGKPCVLRGRVSGFFGASGFVLFKVERDGGEIGIHSRFVYPSWFGAWTSARRSAARFRAGARNGYATTQQNGAKYAVHLTGRSEGFAIRRQKGSEVSRALDEEMLAESLTNERRVR